MTLFSHYFHNILAAIFHILLLMIFSPHIIIDYILFTYTHYYYLRLFSLLLHIIAIVIIILLLRILHTLLRHYFHYC
jgi:hypothetical protein